MRKTIALICMLLLALNFTIEASACCNFRKSPEARILDACKEVMDVFSNREGAHYSCGDDIIFDDIKATYEEGVGICSPTFVALVLYQSKLLTEEQINEYNYNWCGEDGLPSMLESAGWIKMDSSQAMPGDILINYGINAMIYGGRNIYWDYTSCVKQVTGESSVRDITGYSVYRAPSSFK